MDTGEKGGGGGSVCVCAEQGSWEPIEITRCTSCKGERTSKLRQKVKRMVPQAVDKTSFHHRLWCLHHLHEFARFLDLEARQTSQ